MLREKIEEYLDGELDAAGKMALEAEVAANPTAGRMLASAKADRVLRAAAFETFAPTRHEASELAAQVMAEAYAPVGHVGYWIRRGAAVAAAIIIVCGVFVAGRISAPVQNRIVVQTETRVVYSVAYKDLGGEQTVREFATADERDDFVKELDQRGVANVQVADYMVPGQI